MTVVKTVIFFHKTLDRQIYVLYDIPNQIK